MAAGSNFSDLDNEFFINLCGDDEFCDETPDDTDNINIEDLVDGDVAILKDLVDEDPLSNESILEAWRHSVGRQQDQFIRRGESKRSKQRHEKEFRDLKETSKEIPKITTYQK